jgi:hypothetical protein
MDEIEQRIAAIVRHAIESGDVVEVSSEARRLAVALQPDVPEAEIQEALTECAVAARAPLHVG